MSAFDPTDPGPAYRPVRYEDERADEDAQALELHADQLAAARHLIDSDAPDLDDGFWRDISTRLDDRAFALLRQADDLRGGGGF